MTTHEEFNRTVTELEYSVHQLELLILHFRRLERDLWPEPVEKPQEQT